MQIDTRPAEFKDLKDVWLWRNDPLTIKQSKDESKISLQEHTNWFKECITNNINHIFISEDTKKNKLGMTRFDLHDDQNKALVSINLNPLYRGMGIGPIILQSAIDIFTLNHKINLDAVIKKTNVPSINCFKKCGFLHNADSDELCYFTKYI